MVDTGAGWPAGNRATFPWALDGVAVRLSEMAFAPAGMPQFPPTAKGRVSWPGRTGPPRPGRACRPRGTEGGFILDSPFLARVGPTASPRPWGARAIVRRPRGQRVYDTADFESGGPR